MDLRLTTENPNGTRNFHPPIRTAKTFEEALTLAKSGFSVIIAGITPTQFKELRATLDATWGMPSEDLIRHIKSMQE